MDKLNYKLINMVLIMVIICLLYLIKGLWTGIIDMIISVTFPFFLSFIIAYILYPLVKKLKDIGINKYLATIIVILIVITIIVLIVVMLMPVLYNQVLLFISNISIIISDISFIYNIDLDIILNTISNMTSKVINTISKYISTSIINILSLSISFVTTLVIVVVSSIYFLIDMDIIRNKISSYLYKNKLFDYIKVLDIEISKYVKGMGINIIIQTLEYTIVFYLIDHPNYLVLGILSGISSLIPIFGSIIVTIIALLISLVISKKLFILTLIVSIICPQIDSYIIGPKIYGKTNQLHPLIIIFSVFASSIIGGFWLAILSVPIAIIIITTYKYIRGKKNKLF